VNDETGVLKARDMREHYGEKSMKKRVLVAADDSGNRSKVEHVLPS